MLFLSSFFPLQQQEIWRVPGVAAEAHAARAVAGGAGAFAAGTAAPRAAEQVSKIQVECYRQARVIFHSSACHVAQVEEQPDRKFSRLPSIDYPPRQALLCAAADM